MVEKILTITKLSSFFMSVRSGSLIEVGWFKSLYAKEAVDRDNNPIPWCTYSYINFIEKKLKSGFRIFEYGSGNSTRWYAKKVKEIIVVEHNITWHKKMTPLLPDNATLIYRELGSDYTSEILKHGLFDIIIIDGRKRVKSSYEAIKALKPDGVIIWDDAEREYYTDGIKKLKELGFKEMYFDGLRPISPLDGRTSVFYRENNCLNL